MLRRSFLALLNLVPLSAAAKFLPSGLSEKLTRHPGWFITWTPLPNSPTALGAWMGVPISKAEKLRTYDTAMRVLVPRSSDPATDKPMTIGLRRLDYMIKAGVTVPSIGPRATFLESPFKPEVKAGHVKFNSEKLYDKRGAITEHDGPASTNGPMDLEAMKLRIKAGVAFPSKASRSVRF